MRRIVTAYLAILLLVSIGFFGVGAIASAQELRDPMRPPAYALNKFRLARLAGLPQPATTATAVPPPKPLQLTSILFARDRKIAIIDDQALSIGDRVRGATLVALSRDGARLVRDGKVINLSLDTRSNAIRKRAGGGKP